MKDLTVKENTYKIELSGKKLIGFKPHGRGRHAL